MESVMPRRLETKKNLRHRLGNKSENWLAARIERDGFPKPIFLCGRDALFDTDACDAWIAAHEDRRIVVTPPAKAVQP
jgi:hypothetical protein